MYISSIGFFHLLFEVLCFMCYPLINSCSDFWNAIIFLEGSKRTSFFNKVCLINFFSNWRKRNSYSICNFWTPLSKRKLFSAQGLGGTLGPPWGPQGGWSDEHSFWLSSDGLECAGKNVVFVSSLNWHQQNIHNLHFSPFLHQNQQEWNIS